MIWTQSALKDFNGCPRRWYDTWIDGNKPKPTEAMVKGQFFETLCIGAGVGGQVVNSLPLVRGGKKSADQLRIESQARRFKRMFDPHDPEFIGYEIKDTQLELSHNGRKGTIDFVASPLTVFDLKLTSNLDIWDTPDWTQQIHYRWLFEQNYGETPDMAVIVFEYSTQMRVKLFTIDISHNATEEVINRFSEAEENFNEYSTLSEFPRIPSNDQCSKCTLDCNVRRAKPGIIYQTVRI